VTYPGLVGISALSFYHCFDAVGRVTEMAFTMRNMLAILFWNVWIVEEE